MGMLIFKRRDFLLKLARYIATHDANETSLKIMELEKNTTGITKRINEEYLAPEVEKSRV